MLKDETYKSKNGLAALAVHGVAKKRALPNLQRWKKVKKAASYKRYYCMILSVLLKLHEALTEMHWEAVEASRGYTLWSACSAAPLHKVINTSLFRTSISDFKCTNTACLVQKRLYEGGMGLIFEAQTRPLELRWREGWLMRNRPYIIDVSNLISSIFTCF